MLELITFSIVSAIIITASLSRRIRTRFVYGADKCVQLFEFVHLKRIEKDINNIVHELFEINPLIMPYPLRIERFTPSKTTLIEDGTCIVVLPKSESYDEHIAKVINAYVSVGLLPASRNMLDRVVISSLDLFVTKKILADISNKNALQKFLDQVYEPSVMSQKEVKTYCTTFEDLDEMGIFTSILLNELAKLGNQRNTEATNCLVDETRDFVKKIAELATKQPDIDIDPTFIGKEIRTTLILIGGRRSRDGPLRYIDSIRKSIEKGIDAIYLLARGRANVRLTELITQLIVNDRRLQLIFKEAPDNSFMNHTNGHMHKICVLFKVQHHQGSHQCQ